MSKPTTIKIDDVEYVRADQATAPPTGTRCVVVVDRGWVFAGDVERKDGRIKLTRAVHVRRWDGVGFDGMVANPKKNVTISELNTSVDMPADAELFCCPVADDWGL